MYNRGMQPLEPIRSIITTSKKGRNITTLRNVSINPRNECAEHCIGPWQSNDGRIKRGQEMVTGDMIFEMYGNEYNGSKRDAE